jgi:hypothetical protein
MVVFAFGIENAFTVPMNRLQHSHLGHRPTVLCRPRASGRGLLTAWPLWQRGLAEINVF